MYFILRSDVTIRPSFFIAVKSKYKGIFKPGVTDYLVIKIIHNEV
jgi:hypothetical protein